MKTIFYITIGLTFCIACSKQQNKESNLIEDTTVVINDTTVLENNLTQDIITTTTSDTLSDDTELLREKGELVYVSKNEFSYISDPYNFDLNAETIEKLLGGETKTIVEEFEAGEDYSAYTYTTITYKDTEISFYDYSGKHAATITTPLLPLKNGVTIGIKKKDFMSAMGYDGANALKATMYRLIDDYGQMEFSFRADTLYNIYAHYEEGD